MTTATPATIPQDVVATIDRSMWLLATKLREWGKALDVEMPDVRHTSTSDFDRALQSFHSAARAMRVAREALIDRVRISLSRRGSQKFNQPRQFVFEDTRDPIELERKALEMTTIVTHYSQGVRAVT